MTNDHDQRRTICGSALRTLHALEKSLRHHLAELQNLDCDDIDAADAIIFAIAAAEKALTNTLAVRRAQFRD